MIAMDTCWCCRVGEPFVDPWGDERVLTQEDIDRGTLADGTPIAATLDGWTVTFGGAAASKQPAVLLSRQEEFELAAEDTLVDRERLASALRPDADLPRFLRGLATHVDLGMLTTTNFLGHVLPLFVDAPFALLVGLETRFARLPLVLFRSDRAQHLPPGARVLEWSTTLMRNVMILAALAELRLCWRELFWSAFTGHYMAQLPDAARSDADFFAQASARAFANVASAIRKARNIARVYASNAADDERAELGPAVGRAVHVISWRMIDLMRAYGGTIAAGLTVAMEDPAWILEWNYPMLMRLSEGTHVIDIAERPADLTPYAAMALMPERAVYCVESDMLLGEHARSAARMRAFLELPPAPLGQLADADPELMIAAFRLALGMNVRFPMAFWGYGPYRDYPEAFWFARPGVTAVFPAVPLSTQTAVLLADDQFVARYIEGEFRFVEDLADKRSVPLLRTVAEYEEAAARGEALPAAAAPELETAIVDAVYTMRARWIANRHIMECAKEAMYVRYVLVSRALTLRALYDEYCLLMRIVRIDRRMREAGLAPGERLQLYVPRAANRLVFHEVMAAVLDLMLCSKDVQTRFMQNDEPLPPPEREYLAARLLDDAWIAHGGQQGRFAAAADADEAYNRFRYNANLETEIVPLG